MDEGLSSLFEDLRARIDNIDINIVSLLEERMKVVSHISDVKAEHAISVLDSGREKLVLQKVGNAVRNEDFRENMLRIFENIMAESRAYQQRRIEQGSSSLQASKSNALEREALDSSSMQTAADIFAADSIGSKAVPIQLGLLGRKLSHSRSPEIHDEYFRRHKIAGTYDLLEKEPEELGGLIPELAKQGFSGINVTIPYKTSIIRYLDSISPEAKKIGAVNTVKFGEKVLGFNTDYFGFGRLVTSFMQNKPIKTVAVLGTGGSSRAVVAWFEDCGDTSITLVSRKPWQHEDRDDRHKVVGYDSFSAAGFDLVVNTTPVGMYPNSGESPIEACQLAGAGGLIDLVYNPAETKLMKQAAALGIASVNGLAMLVAQAVEAQAIWNEIEYEPADTHAILEKLSK